MGNVGAFIHRRVRTQGDARARATSHTHARASARAARCIICLQLRQESARPSALLPALSVLSRITFAPLFHFARIGRLFLSLSLFLAAPPVSFSSQRPFPFPSPVPSLVPAFRCTCKRASLFLPLLFSLCCSRSLWSKSCR